MVYPSKDRGTEKCVKAVRLNSLGMIYHGVADESDPRFIDTALARTGVGEGAGREEPVGDAVRHQPVDSSGARCGS